MPTTLLDDLLRANPLDELSGVRLGDARLDARCAKVVGTVLSDPAASFPRLAANDTELEGMHRFFNNRRVAPEKLLAPHLVRTVGRAVGLSTVLVIHDSTDVSFDGERI